jgi:hypothetical protein
MHLEEIVVVSQEKKKWRIHSVAQNAKANMTQNSGSSG